MKRSGRWLAAAVAMVSAGCFAATRPVSLAALDAAAEQGDPIAQTRLAVRYENGEGVPRDYQKASALYCKAARHGYADAQFRLGWMYANGRGMARDDAVAAALFTMAAKQGHEYAARMLHYVRPVPGTPFPSCMTPEPPSAPVRAGSGARGGAVAEGNVGEGGRGEIRRLVRRLAPQYAIDPALVMALIKVESGFDPTAVSPKNAQGVMQLMPKTAKRFGVKQVFNPADNIRGGLAYLRWLLALFQGNVRLVLAAYNAGEHAVEHYRGVPPYAETRRYVRKIIRIYKHRVHPYETRIVDPSPIMARFERSRG